ncbi:MAG: ATP-binding cassette domain-containing protein [Campylobacteraceae bacterium]|jgi:putative ABC transport system ATP-binding protein|nr:ATP-binding cassette domain-containing protein [Campylobacteraceae bacterium]
MKNIILKDVKVRFKEHLALDILALEIGNSVKLAVTGESGSGKSTLLNILCLLEEINHGKIFWNNKRVDTLTQMQKDKFRYDNVGLVMQDFYLYPGLSALQNVLLPLKFRYFKIPKQFFDRAVYLLKRLNITQHSKNIDIFSRGEKQRIAIARALINSPKVIIADEPTASLDAQNSAEAVKLLLSLADETKSALICATHDKILIKQLTYRLELKKGGKIEACFT